MKVFITKYALTKGIIEVEGETTSSTTMVRYKSGKYPNQYIHKPFWYENREEAVKHAEELRKRKIASVKSQITKLEKITF